MPKLPVRYFPSVEQAEPDEAETTQGMIDALRDIAETTFKDSGHAWRGVHAKSHGLLSAQLRVDADLPSELAQGLFAQPGNYPVVMRFSTSPGDVVDDDISTPRGLAIKIIGVEGDRLSGSDGDITQDFVMINSPAFAASTAKAFLGNLKLLSKTTDKVEGLKKVLSAVLRGAESALEAVGGESGTLKSLGGHPRTHILGETFFTQTPLRFGDYIAKLSLAPVSSNLTALTDQPLQDNGTPNPIREAVAEFFSTNGGEWELRAQLCRDLDAMPVEDSSKPWSEDLSPYLPIGRIIAQPQDSWSPSHVKAIDDGMSFSPWHGITAHQPLGSIMRVRRDVYKSSATFRGQHNGCPMHEPKGGL